MVSSQLLDELQKGPDGKTIIKCRKTTRKQLNEKELVDCRVFYWAANLGMDEYVRLMILQRRWSPFIKSFEQRSIVSGCIIGKRTELLQSILGEYTYEGVDQESMLEIVNTFFTKDDSDNTSLHYAYMMDLPEVRELLR